MSNKKYLVGIISVVTILAFGSGFFLGANRVTRATLVVSGNENAPDGIDMAPVWKVWHLLEEKYVPVASSTQISKQDRVWGMIEGLTRAYGDPYTTFFPPQQAKNFQEEIRGNFGGVGIEIGMREGSLVVIAPLKDTPGEKAGIRAGDFIVKIDGVSTQNMDVDKAVGAIRGKVGTQVIFTIARKDEPEFLTIPVTRDTINVPTIKTEKRSDGVFVISLYNFGGSATQETQKALRSFKESKYKKLILDLRGNPGGYLESAVEIASWFLPAGEVVVSEDFGKDVERQFYRSKGYDVVGADTRIAVLIDGGSASASEILAGALQEHRKATLIGEKSFGKGSVQEMSGVTPDTSLKVTVARWLTPNGVSISNGGLIPDIEVKITKEDIDAKRDPQLDRAIRFVKEGK